MDPTDSNHASQGTQSEPARTERSVGQSLKAARLDRGMSIEEVARQLRLSVRQIAALESDNYGKLSSTTFLRGFVRNYAKLMRMDAAPLLERLEQSVPPPPTPTISYQIEGIPFPSNQGRGTRNLIIAGVVLALLLLIYAVYSGNEGNREKPQSAVKVETGTETGQAAALSQFQPPSANSGNDADAGPPGETARLTEQKPEGPRPVQTTVSPPAPGRQVTAGPAVTPESRAGIASESANEGGDVLRFLFEGESWIEVKDGRGRVILSQIKPRGAEQVLHGQPPFSLVIGNAAQVRLVYNDRPVDLTPYTNTHGGTARLSLK
ncbi:MAG: DUF4115 domain-containing protein [Nitrosospira sp.]|nr:DUF4115 domain-containing protein [Nitrosospira sp.]